MSDGSANGHREEAALELVPHEVAELAAEMSETQSATRRRKLARQLSGIVSQARQAPGRTVQAGAPASRAVRSGSQAAWKGVRSGGRQTVQRLQTVGQRLSGEILEMAPKIPIRSLATLQAQYPGRSTEDLANALIAGAARASAGMGAAVGAAAAVPFVPTLPVELVVETVGVVAIELKLIAELHEVYGSRAPGNAAQRMAAYVGSWADRRGVQVTSGGLVLAVGSPLRRRLERRLAARVGRSALSLAPLLTGLAAGAGVNFAETKRLGTLIRADLRKRAG
jgi:hypothetical protein